MQVDRQWQDALLCQAGGRVFVQTLRAEGKARRGDALASDGALGLLCIVAVSVDVCSAVVLARVTATGWRESARETPRPGPELGYLTPCSSPVSRSQAPCHSPLLPLHDLSPDEPFQMSWNLLERFIESDHFNEDPSLSVAYLSCVLPVTVPVPDARHTPAPAPSPPLPALNFLSLPPIASGLLTPSVLPVGMRITSAFTMCSARSCANSPTRTSSSSCPSYATSSSASTMSRWPLRNSS